MSLYSKIVSSEKIQNKKKSSTAADFYFPVWVEDEKGLSFALFTERELTTALNRGEKNPEDVVPPMSAVKRVWINLLKLFKLK